ncbi:hypothetical protein [Phytohabitans rumicis]|uniref:Uncharacterized protein n=1 Tax=Phytohabitans rumicis TaxID=1076125 RepID=A0A6V8L027_9ACTN|nr:hypothetical protein [Phytohabitans rumicis]GFJ90692.1 hypothetical protein Prum_043340 [Phytohabitans rumicis]
MTTNVEYDDGLDVESFRFTRETQMQFIEDELRELGITKEELRAQAAEGYFTNARVRYVWMMGRELI